MDVIAACLAAGRIEQLAAPLRPRPQHPAAVAQSMAWHSLAGDSFRRRAHEVCLDATALGAALDALAVEIRARATHR